MSAIDTDLNPESITRKGRTVTLVLPDLIDKGMKNVKWCRLKRISKLPQPENGSVKKRNDEIVARCIGIVPPFTGSEDDRTVGDFLPPGTGRKIAYKVEVMLVDGKTSEDADAP